MNTRKYLTLLLSVFSVLPLLLIMGGSMLFFENYATNGIRSNLECTAKLNAKNAEQFFAERVTSLKVIAGLPEIQKLLNASNAEDGGTAFKAEQSRANELMKSITQLQNSADDSGKTDSPVKRSVLVNRAGYAIASDDASAIGVFSVGNQSLRAVSSSDFYLSDLLRNPAFLNGNQYFNIVVPIFQDGNYEGFVQSCIDTVCFDRLLNGKNATTGQLLLIDPCGAIAGERTEDGSGAKIESLSELSSDDGFYQKVWKKIDWENNSSGLLTFRENGKEMSGYYCRLQGTGWAVFSTTPQSQLLGPLFGILWFYGATILIFSVFLILISHVAARRFLTPMRALTAAFMRLKQRDYSIRLPGCYKGEFGEIASLFNQLAAWIEEDTEALQVSEARYALIMEETNQIIFEWDILNNHLYHTVHWTNKFGFGQKVENPGGKIPDFSPVHPEDREKLAAFFTAARLGEPPKPIDVRMKTIESRYIWCTVSIKVTSDPAGTPSRAIGLISDTDRKKKMIESLESRTKMDLLTHLYNKMTAEEMIEDFLSASAPERRHGFIILDIDNFKGINDTLGHIYGDEVLRTVSARLQSLFRSTDIVGRAGGDEFIILIKDVPDRYALTDKLLEICHSFQSLYFGKKSEQHISASVGAALFPDDGKTFSELYRNADAAMYHSKETGKNRFCLYCKKK